MSHSELFGLKGQKESGLAGKHGEEYFEKESAQQQELLASQMRSSASGPKIEQEKSTSKSSNTGGLLSKLVPDSKPPNAQGGNRCKSGGLLENLSLPGDGNAYDGVVGMGHRV